MNSKIHGEVGKFRDGTKMKNRAWPFRCQTSNHINMILPFDSVSANYLYTCYLKNAFGIERLLPLSHIYPSIHNIKKGSISCILSIDNSFVFLYNIPYIKEDTEVEKCVPTPNLTQVEPILGSIESQNSKMLKSKGFVLVPATIPTNYHKPDDLRCPV